MIYVAEGGHFRQCIDFRAVQYIVVVAAAGSIGFEPNIHCGGLAAVRPFHAAKLAVAVAVFVCDVPFVIFQINGFNAGAVQIQQFAFVGIAVLVGIAPNLELLPHGITGIDFTVAVTIVLFERFKAVFGTTAVGEQGLVAEQFAAVIDLAVAVQIQSQQTVIRRRPAALLGKAVAVVVEM